MQNRYPVIGTIEDWEIKPSESYVIAIAKPNVKKCIVEKLEKRGARFVAIIHPTAKISASASYGKGLVMYPNAVLGPDSLIGDYVTLLISSVGHDARIGDYSTISSYCGINGGVVLEEQVFVGSHAAFMPKVHVGKRAKVGIGSVVVRNVQADCTVIGNPAKKVMLDNI